MISSEVSDFTTFCGHANSRSQNVIEGTLKLWFEKHWRSSKIANNFSSFPHKFIAIFLWEEKNHRLHASKWSSIFFMLVDAIFCPIKRTLQIHMRVSIFIKGPEFTILCGKHSFHGQYVHWGIFYFALFA